MKAIISVLVLICIMSCQTKGQTTTIRLEAQHDSCYILKDSASRIVEILENTLSDTVIFGASVVYPKYTGIYKYLRLDKRVDFLFDPQTPEKYLPKTKLLCLSLYQNRRANGYLLIRLKND